MKSLSQAILRTLTYADIFDYPLTADEICWFLISEKKQNEIRRASNTQDDIKKELAKKSHFLSPISYHDGFYFLKGRKKTIDLRKKREQWSQKKLQIALRVARWLRLIPWIKMVAVTGALAMKNADQKDDIDLLVVTNKNRLWLSRLLVVFLVELIAQRRHPGDKDVRNKICLNMFLDEAHLKIPKKEQDLFTAHEVVQLNPLWDKDEVYQKFLRVNQWVEKYLPNFFKWRMTNGYVSPKELIHYPLSIINFSERFARQTQLWYMSSRRTTEVVEPGRVRFHPQDCREWILEKYHKRLVKMKLVRESS
jgi:hypothetical protein